MTKNKNVLVCNAIIKDILLFCDTNILEITTRIMTNNIIIYERF